MSTFSHRLTLLTFFLASSHCGLMAHAQGAEVESPQKRIKVALDSSAGSLSYSISITGRTAIQPSSLGITVDGQNLGKDVVWGKASARSFKETYPVMGVHAMALNSYQEAIFPVQSGPNKVPWQLEVRAFDDGVAMRYRVPGAGTRLINGESSNWKLPAGSVVWYQTDTSNYERAFGEQQVEQLAKDTKFGAPLTAKLPDGQGYAFLSEANVVNYSDMALQVQGPNTIGAVFDKNSEGWKHEGEIVSPWRVTLLARDLNELVNSDMLRNLCPPPLPELVNATWIRPGRSNWHWMVTGRPEFTVQNKWVDWTQRLGFEYYLIDDGWRDWNPDGKDAWTCIKQVVDYATPRNVQIWAWVHSREVHLPQQRATYFQKAKAAGLVGLKIDFPERPDTEWINWYEDVLRNAAKFHLMIDFHGAVKPTGRERTWPNEMTREAIYGRESGKLPGLHDAALPFTRYVQGHADFTPVEFRTSRLGNSSWAHELAQAVIYTSPFLCYGGSPESYLQNPALDILQAIPPTWDETRVLADSEIGRTAAFARRKGDTWFVAVVNGDEARPLKIKLDFLGEGSYRADLLADAPENNAAWKRTQKTLTGRSTIATNLRGNGGFVARFTKINR